jgi:hypothetical protein
MLSQNNISHVFVGTNAALGLGTAAALTAGQIGVFVNGSLTGSNVVLPAGSKFQVLINSGGRLINSPFIDTNNIVGRNRMNYTAPANKRVYVGYNGTDGAIGVANNTVYTMHMNMQDGSKTWGEHPYFKMLAAYRSDATATQTEIADALVVNAVKNFEREVAVRADHIEVGRINSAPVVAGNRFSNNATVVRGTNTISLLVNTQYGAAQQLLVNDYVRLGTIGAGTALTSGVYKVLAINALVVTLDRPVNEPSGVYATATNDAEVIPAANILNWGLSFTAKDLPFEPGMKKYAKLLFDVQLGTSFPTTPVRTAVTPAKGEGTYAEVAEVEWLLNGNRGETYRVADFPVNSTLAAVPASTYDTIVVHYRNNNSIQIDRDVNSYGTLIFYVATNVVGVSGSVAYTNLQTVFGA